MVSRNATTMMAKDQAVRARSMSSLGRLALAAGLVTIVACLGSGCTRNAASQWAQNSPIILPEPHEDSVSLGARPE